MRSNQPLQEQTKLKIVLNVLKLFVICCNIYLTLYGHVDNSNCKCKNPALPIVTEHDTILHIYIINQRLHLVRFSNYPNFNTLHYTLTSLL